MVGCCDDLDGQRAEELELGQGGGGGFIPCLPPTSDKVGRQGTFASAGKRRALLPRSHLDPSIRSSLDSRKGGQASPGRMERSARGGGRRTNGAVQPGSANRVLSCSGPVLHVQARGRVKFTRASSGRIDVGDDGGSARDGIGGVQGGASR